MLERDPVPWSFSHVIDSLGPRARVRFKERVRAGQELVVHAASDAFDKVGTRSYVQLAVVL